MIDTGAGYHFITEGRAFVPYPPPYIYESTYTANGLIENPTTGKQDLVNPKDTFHLGESMAILSRINEVTASHMWKMEIWHQRPEDTEPQFWWHFESGWNDVGDGWDYSEIYFTQTAEDLGTFHFKVYLELGQGYFLLGEKLTEVVE